MYVFMYVFMYAFTCIYKIGLFSIAMLNYKGVRSPIMAFIPNSILWRLVLYFLQRTILGSKLGVCSVYHEWLMENMSAADELSDCINYIIYIYIDIYIYIFIYLFEYRYTDRKIES